MAQIVPVNVRRIAEEAGVSHITVSRALRGVAHVSVATRARVLEVAERLGYQTNPLVQAFAAQIRRGRGAPTVCNLAWLPSRSADARSPEPWAQPYLQGAKQRALELGFSLDDSINAHDYSDEKLQRLLENRGVRGVLIPHMIYYERWPFSGSGMVVVGLGESPDAQPMHTVTPDFFKNMTTAIDALLALGYRRIGFCEHSHSTVLSQGMHWGSFLFNQQRLPARLPMLGNLRLKDEEREHSRVRFMRWFRETQPDVILTTFYQIQNWLQAEHVQVPRDVGLAHLSLADDVAGWSGIDPESRIIGSEAVDLLASHILRNEYGVPKNAKLQRLPGTWVDASTTRAPGRKIKKQPASHTHPHEWFERWFWKNPPPTTQ